MEMLLQKEIFLNKPACRYFAIGVMMAFMALGAFVRIPLPFTPVPLTLQTFFVLLSAALLGRKLSWFALLGYIAFGVMGVPVFAGANSGWLYAFGPTAGYFAGFALATVFIAFSLGSHNASWRRITGIFALADILILLCGALWLKLLLRLSGVQALALGFLPFIPGDILKVLAAAVVYKGINRRVSEIIA